MPITNNSVRVTAGLTSSAISNPPIGTSSVSATIGYSDGDPALDQYISVTATTSPGTALHADLVGAGFVFVFNPSANTNAVEIYAGSTHLGPLPPGFATVVPVASGVIIKGVCASTQSVGVTAIKTTANA